MTAMSFTRGLIKGVSEQCNELKSNLPLISFTHDIITTDFRAGMLANSEVVSDLYQNKKLSYNYLNKDGSRVMEQGFHSSQMLARYLSDEIRPSEQEFFDALNLSHCLHYYKKTEVTSQLLTFGFNCSDASFHNLLLNEKMRLIAFIETYELQNHDLIEAAASPENTMLLKLAESAGSGVVVNDRRFLDLRTGLFLVVTDKQANYLNLFLQGLTAKQIAEQVHRSFRTVQHQLDSIRHSNQFSSSKAMLLNIKLIS
jgi:hypothetical protein